MTTKHAGDNCPVCDNLWPAEYAIAGKPPQWKCQDCGASGPLTGHFAGRTPAAPPPTEPRLKRYWTDRRQAGFISALGIKVLVGVVIAAAMVGLYRWWAESQREQGRMEVRAQWAEARDRQNAAALAAAAANAAETERRLRAQKDAQDENDRLLAAARRDAAGAAAAAGRLRQQLATFTAAARGTPSHPTPVGDGPPAAPALDLLADLFSRADVRAGELAAFADAAHAAGQQCVREYDSLSKP